MVSETPTEGRCNAEIHDGYCEGWQAKDESGEVINGRCRKHGGHEDSGAPKGSKNATTHGAYTDKSDLYDKVFSEPECDLVDRIEADYLERYLNSNGHEPTTGEGLRIFKMAVNAVTEMRVENWYTAKPEELETGTPLIDKETHVSEEGRVYYRYKKSPATAARKHLESYNRQWGKTMGLFDDPESEKAGAIGDLAGVILESESN